MARRNECKQGQHHFTAQPGGVAGIGRNVCRDCGTVAIYLTDETTVTTVSPKLYGARDEAPVDGREWDLLTLSAAS